MLHDLRYAARLLRRSPGFTAVSILTLAMGIGINAAIFSLVDGMMFRALPFRDPGRLVMLKALARQTGQTYTRVDRVDFEQIAAHHTGFDGIAVLEQGAGYTWVGSDGADSISSVEASPNLLSVLGVEAMLGRPVGPGDERAEPRRAMLTCDAWKRRFGGDPSTVGRIISFDQRSLEIVGILPPRFIFPLQGSLADGDLLVAVAPDPGDVANPKAGVWTPIARLKAGVSIEQARAEVDMLVRRTALQYPETRQDRALAVINLQFALFELSRPLLWLMVGAAGFVLLIGCANLASLLMARGTARQPEMAVRAAIGAGRWRLIRLSLVESFLLSALGAVAGVVLAVWTFHILTSLVPPRQYRLVPDGLDLRAVLFAFCASLLCAAVFGILPALRLSMPKLSVTLRGGRSGGHAVPAFKAGALLVAAEVALGLILLCGAGLMVNSLVRARTVDLGFEPSRALWLSVSLPRSRYATPSQQFDFQMALLDRVRQIPGVAVAGAIDSVQIGGLAPPRGLGADTPRGSGLWSVTPGFFNAMQTPIVAGRDFTDREGRGDAGVALVNETAAAYFWPGERGVGQVLRLERQQPLQVIGVVKDVRYGYGRGAVASVYRAISPADCCLLTIVARVSADAGTIGARMRNEAQRMDPRLVVRQPDTIANVLHRGFANSRFETTLFALFAGLGLVLAGTGIYGVISYWVMGRTREIGVRLALGAAPRDVRRLVVMQASIPVAAGLIAGLAAAFALTRQLRSLLYEITPYDPATLVAAAVMLFAVGVAAAYIPARRAARVDPMIALRAE